jgi:hypothetical protein
MRSGGEALSLPDLLGGTEIALEALWCRCCARLGEVTVMAICDRVLHNARERFPDLASCVSVDHSGFRFDAMRERVITRKPADCKEVLEFLVIEFLRILGRLTAEALTPALHAELKRITLGAASRRESTKQDS